MNNDNLYPDGQEEVVYQGKIIEVVQQPMVVGQKKKAVRKDVESKHAAKQLEKQATATFWSPLV